MNSNPIVAKNMFDLVIDLADDFESAITTVFCQSQVVKQYNRDHPTSLLADSIRYIVAGRVNELRVQFRGISHVWQPGSYQLTLDAFRFIGCLANENLSGESILDVGCGSDTYYSCAHSHEHRRKIFSWPFTQISAEQLRLCPTRDLVLPGGL